MGCGGWSERNLQNLAASAGGAAVAGPGEVLRGQLDALRMQVDGLESQRQLHARQLAAIKGKAQQAAAKLVEVPGACTPRRHTNT